MLSLKEFFSKPQREARLFQWFHALSVALLLAVVVLFARFCAFQSRDYLRRQADSAQLWILQEQSITRGFGLQL